MSAIPPPVVDGVDLSSEGIDSLRQALIIVRSQALIGADFHLAVLLSHVIVALSWLSEIAHAAR